LPIGLNRQWCSPTLVRPFRFGGVASGFDPGATARAQMLDAAARVSAETGLRGLCSLDVIVDRRGDAFALELNPRPTASAELYDRDAPGLLRLHLAAVAGGALPEWRPPVGSRALAVVYAPIAMCLGVPPTAVADWRRGAEVGIGDPLCTLHASGPDATVAMRRGRSSAGRLLRGLKRPARRGQNTGSAQ
jgi:predicted ATP-grasp superfamily ATP-dependent carboligase